MDRPVSPPTLETIARTIDEFSFIFPGLPPRLPPSVKQRHYRSMNGSHHLPTGLSNGCPSPSRQRDHVFQSFERKDKPPLPPSPPPPQHFLREGRPEEAEPATPQHIHYDSDRGTIPAKSCSSSTESGIPPPIETESKGHPLPPYADTPTTPKLEMMNHLRHVHHPPTTKKRCQLPKDYTKLPHFHPPRFSRRLRDLVAERRPPMRLHLLPVLRKPAQDEEKGHVTDSYWVITSPDVEAAQVKPRRFWKAMDRRTLSLIIFAVLFGGVIMLAFVGVFGRSR
ncbi:hypothetical protein HOY82DRAFT_563737 [Tuber indicum]|nr:hypothetical protein HOY82DRAFT_563737 [Tuber indicum]